MDKLISMPSIGVRFYDNSPFDLVEAAFVEASKLITLEKTVVSFSLDKEQQDKFHLVWKINGKYYLAPNTVHTIFDSQSLLIEVTSEAIKVTKIGLKLEGLLLVDHENVLLKKEKYLKVVEWKLGEIVRSRYSHFINWN
jgi:hypothetical protein